jgi:hypothetical protein
MVGVKVGVFVGVTTPQGARVQELTRETRSCPAGATPPSLAGGTGFPEPSPASSVPPPETPLTKYWTATNPPELS